MSRESGTRWLLAGLIGVIAFGLAFVLLPDLMQQLFNWLLFGSTESPFSAEVNDYLVFVYGVLGAVVVGWAITMFYVANGAYRNGEKSALMGLAVPLIVWYVIDSIFSVATGHWQNAALNTGFLLILGVPLIATRRHFS